MKTMSSSFIGIVFILLAYTKVIAANEPPVCSTITDTTTDHCQIIPIEGEKDAKALVYDLTSRLQTVNVFDGAADKTFTIHDALVYNGSLAPERLELRRDDALEIRFTNQFPAQECTDTVTENCFPARLVSAAGDHDPRKTNLHTHGFEVPWAFNGVPPDLYGDDVLSFTLDPVRASSSAHEGMHGGHAMGGMPHLGNTVNYWYPFSPYHPIGLDWYHPHPHGVTGLQVEGGMAGLLTIAMGKSESEDAEAALSPIYLQLKDMQTRKLDADNYSFEKFVPDVATACFERGSAGENNEWEFVGNVPGRCNYKNGQDNYSWFFFVNGEIFPTMNVPKKGYFRIANNSANATYRLTLVPAETEPGKTYFVPPFEAVEKDGITSTTGSELQCTPTLTPATRAGFGVDFLRKSSGTGKLCKVDVTAGADGSVSFKTTPEENANLNLLSDTISYKLVQQGINTGEDDWPPIELAKLQLTDAPLSDWAGYSQAVAKANAVSPTHMTDSTWSKLAVKEPDPNLCQDLGTVTSTTGYDRAVVLFFGKKNGDEVFGLVSSGEKIRGGSDAGKVVDAQMIDKWRNAFLDKFTQVIVPPTGSPSDQLPLEYDAPELDGVLEGLDLHRFSMEKTNICTRLRPRPERWRVYNMSAQIHNFHIHQTKFEVKNVRGAACSRPGYGNPYHPKAYELVGDNNFLPKVKDNTAREQLRKQLEGRSDEQCVKTYGELFFDVPGQFTLAQESVSSMAATERMPGHHPRANFGMHDTFPVPPMGYIDVEIPFTSPEKVGVYVFHCHILEHEDAGMMGKIVVRSR